MLKRIALAALISVFAASSYAVETNAELVTEQVRVVPEKGKKAQKHSKAKHHKHHVKGHKKHGHKKHNSAAAQ